MTWYAYHLFAEASPSLLDKFLASPVMSKGVYWVRDLTDYPWHDSRVKHDLPPNGLLVVRPICSPSTHEAKWYGNQIISWFDIQTVVSPFYGLCEIFEKMTDIYGVLIFQKQPYMVLKQNWRNYRYKMKQLN
jgi:hypothetical protein